jgi:O-antigen/teichoic acid export membrane protein
MRFWLVSERAVGVRFAGQFMLTSSWAYTVFYLLAFVVSLDAVGVVRLAQLAIGPLTVASAGVQSAMIPLAAKRFLADRRLALRFLFIAGAVTAIVTALWSVGVYALPAHVGTKLFGPSWPGARKVVLYIGLGFVLGGFSGASNAGLRALRAANANLKLAAAMIPFTFAPALGLAAADGARGFAIGVAVSFAVYAVAGWYVLVRASKSAMQRPAGFVEPAAV